MPVENAQYINQLDATLPSPTDPKSEGDDHLREIKRVLKATFPAITGPITATADQINSPFPIGGIINFVGSTIPSGWALCNGQTVARSDAGGTITTPDLRDRFVLGAGAVAAGSTGGNASITVTTTAAGEHGHVAYTDVQGAHSHGGAVAGASLTTAQLPPHAHTYGSLVPTGGAGNGLYFPSNLGVAAIVQTTESVGNGETHAHGITSDGGHAHGVGVNPAGAHSHVVTADIRPPYYALAFIMKI